MANINGPIRDLLLGKDAIDQQGWIRAMIALDGTENKATWAPTPSSPCPWLRPRQLPRTKGVPLYAHIAT